MKNEIATEKFTSPKNEIAAVRMRENTDQKNSEYGHFSRSMNNGVSK